MAQGLVTGQNEGEQTSPLLQAPPTVSASVVRRVKQEIIDPTAETVSLTACGYCASKTDYGHQILRIYISRSRLISSDSAA